MIEGKYSGRPFDPSRAGTRVQRLDFRRAHLTERGVARVEAHLERFGGEALRERQMLERLKETLAGTRELTDAARRFYTHELREYVRYRLLGQTEGQPDSADAAHDLWNNAHTAALEDYQLREGPGVLYDRDVEDRR